MRQILLASSSPRRREILEDMGLPFVLVEPGKEDSSSPAKQTPRALVARAARSKAEGAKLGQHHGLLLAVDTLVALGPLTFGKPRDRDEAERYLLALEGRSHEVWTAMCMTIVDAGKTAAVGYCEIQCQATVAMRRLEQEERSSYLASGDWRDKAGGYGIQSLAATFVSLVCGEIGTVIGLPSAAFLRYWEPYSTGGSLPHV